VTASYQDLEGGSGRSVYFRAPRYRPQALVGEEVPTVRLGEQEARLHDVSLSGLACQLVGGDKSPAPGAVVPVEVWFRNERAFYGNAEVVRSQPGNRGTRVGLRFLDCLFEPADLRSLGQEALFRDALDEGSDRYAAVPEGYRRAVAEVVVVLSHWRDLLTRREEQLQLANGRQGHEALGALEEVAEKQMRQEWERVRAKATEESVAAYASPESLLAAKRLTELLVTPILIGAPIWRLGYTKPRGYPGDFELMNLMYDGIRMGRTSFDRIMHQLGREERLAATVSDRKEFLIRHLGDTALSTPHRSGDLIEITSLGAGPAREIEEFVARGQGGGMRFTLVDQDEEALECAHERIRRAALKHGSRIELRCRYVSLRQLLTQGELLDEVRNQHLIYSAGLFDYLGERMAKALVGRLFECLRPSGHLLIGNAVDDEAVKWVPEFVLDWKLLYRSADAMLDLLDPKDLRAKVDLQHDRSGAWQFLVVQRL